MDSHVIMPSAGSERTKFFYGYVIVLAAFFILAILNGTMYSFGVFLKPLATEFGWTRAVTSGAYSVFLLLAGFLYIVTGSLNDKFGPRIVMTASGFLLSLGYLLMSQTSTIWQLYLFYGVIIAMGQSGGFVPLISTIARWFVKRRGIMTGIVVSGIGVGTIVMPPVASQLITSYGWRISYLIIGIIVLVILMVITQFLKSTPNQVGQLPDGAEKIAVTSVDADAQGFALRTAMGTGRFWMLGILYFCLLFCIITIMAHIVPHATDLGISSVSAASIISIIGGFSIAGRIGMGIVSDRIGNKLSLIISSIVMSGAFLWLLVASALWMFYLFAIVLGFAYGGLIVLMSPTVAELFGIKAHGAILGVIVFIDCAGGAIGSFVAGWIFDITNSYYLAFLVCTILSIIALIAALLLQPTRSEDYVKAQS